MASTGTRVDRPPTAAELLSGAINDMPVRFLTRCEGFARVVEDLRTSLLVPENLPASCGCLRQLKACALKLLSTRIEALLGEFDAAKPELSKLCPTGTSKPLGSRP